MKYGLIRKSLILMLLAGMSQFAVADDASAAKTIAGIVAGMNHFPSDTEKQVLMGISEDNTNSQAVRSIALAVHNTQHQATAEDKARLNEIMASDASAEVKALAEVLVGFLHSASEDAQARLRAI